MMGGGNSGNTLQLCNLKMCELKVGDHEMI